ncbi:ribosomal protein L22 [freshwater metagenome]|uniref:Ribosomal protein L22 n=1 Tax=freshwater metagenome TaxID=449393 RepID=A0A094SF70_9ZZZZ
MRGLLVANTETALVARAILRETRTTPQKARRVVNIVRGERADTALTTLKFANQEVAGELYTLLASAVANAKAKNPSLRDASELWVAEALVDEGFTLKRFRPRAQGRGFTIRKRTSTITFVVSDDRNYRSNGPAKRGKVVKHAPVVKEVAKEVATEAAAPVAKKAAAKKAPAKKAQAKKAISKVETAKEGKAE